MIQSLDKALIALQDIMLEMLPKDEPLAFNYEVPLDYRNLTNLNLKEYDKDYWTAELVLEESYRVGPAEIAPTRHQGIVYLSLFHKGNRVNSIHHPKVIAVAENIAERTHKGIRFRTFFPHMASVESGYTRFSGAIEFDFELYRGDRNGY